MGESELARDQAKESAARTQLVADQQLQLIEISCRLQEVSLDTFDAELEKAMESAARLAGADRTVLTVIRGRDYAGRFSFGEEAGLIQRLHKDVNDESNAFTWSRALILSAHGIES